MAKRTLEENIANTKALLAKYEAKLANRDAVLDIAVSDRVNFTFGRGDKKRDLAGTVLAYEAPIVAVLSDEGINSKIYKINARDVTGNESAATRNTGSETEVVVADALTGVATEGASVTPQFAAEDPLNNA